jgi:aminopeptidase N
VNDQIWRQFKIENETLIVSELPQSFVLETVSKIFPATNKSCEGLYLSGGSYFTQCEAEGFRKITWFYDRPDVLATYVVGIKAEAAKFPKLLSNGNLVSRADLGGGRHYVCWEDPFPKSCYLFALVAGPLSVLKDQWTTKSGKSVDLEVYAKEADLSKCHHGMNSLKQSLKWDEEVYGLECDLANYKIVAVGDFNMGAMENKGLNIFNTSAILASPDTTTDDAFDNVQSTVAHEYFHNWSGNRVTCRDWFQLCLKEGFTVFRHQEFASDTNSRSVQRIRDVSELRNRQFVEDAGPMSHPVRPSSFIEINNFYTTTIYEKGAEICRMIATVLGADLFRKGTDLYFSRHDGQGVTIEDFLSAISDGSGIDVKPFIAWYEKAGTPVVRIREHYDADRQTLSLHFSQFLKDAHGVEKPCHFPIPVKFGLLDREGNALPVNLKDAAAVRHLDQEVVLWLRHETQEFTFYSLSSKPLVSAFRGFSAPVLVEFPMVKADLFSLVKLDPDAFQRWDKTQQVLVEEVLSLSEALKLDPSGKGVSPSSEILEGLLSILVDPSLDSHFRSLALTLPSLDILQQQVRDIDFKRLAFARKIIMKSFSENYWTQILGVYRAITSAKDYQFEPKQVGGRALKNCLLNYLGCVELGESLAYEQYDQSTNMTERLGSLKVIVGYGMKHKQKYLDHFFETFKQDDLVLDSWFRLLASSDDEESLATFKYLLNHPQYNRLNPNRARSVLAGFSIGNLPWFHEESGQGYRMFADELLRIDPSNPQIAARLARGFGPYQRSAPAVKAKGLEVLKDMIASPGLSKDLYEVIQTLIER